MSEDTLFRSLAAVSFALMFGASIYYRHKADRKGGRVGRQEEPTLVRLGLSVSGLLGFAGLLVYFIRPSLLEWTMVPLPAALQWTGVALAFASTAFTVWIFTSLGNNVTRTVLAREGANLVTTGPYRFIRHPLYTNGTLAFTALSLVTRSWWFAACVAVSLAFLAIRTRQEEANLEARFGDEWRRYASRTGRFLPKLV